MNHFIRFTSYLFSFLAVFTVAYSVYVGAFSGPMLLDDAVNLESARLYKLDRHAILSVITQNYSGMLGRGLSSLSFGLTHYFHGAGTYYFKYHNFMIHCLTALALFYLGFRLLLLTRYASKALWVAGLSTFIWFIHPLQVSTVLYIVQRMAQLSALFTVIALVCYVIGRVRIEEGRRFGVLIIFIGYPFFLVLGLLSKENAALCILFTLAIEGFFFVSTASKEGLSTLPAGLASTRARYRWLIRVCFIVIPLMIGLVGGFYKLDSLLIGYEARPFNLFERVLTQVHILIYYLQLILFPRLSEYSLYHDDFPIIREFGWGTLVRLIAIVGILATCVISVYRRKQSIILFGIAWFLIGHSMESTILPLEMIFEHRNYLSLYGISLALSWFFIIRLPKLTNMTNVSYGIAILFCMLCIFVLSVRVDAWKSKEQLTLVNVTDHPESSRAHTARANVLARYGDSEGMIKHLSIAYELKKWDSGAAIHRLSGACYFGKLSPYIINQAVTALNGTYLTAYTWLAIDNLILNIEMGLCNLESDQVVSLLDSIDSSIHGSNRKNQAKKEFFKARFYQYLGDAEQALIAYDRAIDGDKERAYFPAYKVKLLISLGRFDEANNELLLMIEKDKLSIRDGTILIRSLYEKMMAAQMAGMNENTTN